MKSVYLCGPITGLSYGECTDWRKHVAKELADDIVPLSPMRGKQYLEDCGRIEMSYEKTVLSRAAAITCRDRRDVMECDLLFANFLGAKVVSIGSVIELGWADAFRKPIVFVAEKDNIHHHVIVDELCGFQVETLEEGIMVANAVLSEGFARKYQ